jgi:ABC-type lipoprotein export system ATPase subunit
MEPFIFCENLVKIYPLDGVEIVALQGLDLAVEKGELLGIVGASGSGKSTLLNVLGGLDRPSAGAVRVAGRDLLKMTEVELDEYRRTEVGFVWQQTTRNLIPYLTALQNVELPMRVAGRPGAERRRWAREILEALGLGERLHHSPAMLSGGEQQRVAIGVALANRPALLLADEPTGEVDTATAGEIYSALRQVNELYGMTVIIVSHDPHLAHHTHRVVAIRDGKTSTETVRAAPRPPLPDQIREKSPLSPPAGEEVGEGERAVHFEELAVLDGAGRVQLPREYLDRLNIGDRVRLELSEEFIAIHPVAGRGRAARRADEAEPDLVELYVEEDLAPQAENPSPLSRLLQVLRKRKPARRSA